MSKNNKDSDVFTWLIGALIAIMYLVASFAMMYWMKALFFYAKKPVIEKLKLDALSASWPTFKWLYEAISWTIGLLFLLSTAQYIRDIAILMQLIPMQKEISTNLIGSSLIVDGILAFLFSLVCAFVFNVIQWIKDCYNSPDVQKKLAGIKAEQYVQKVLKMGQSRYPEAQILNNVLFFFNAGTATEFSVEVDHLVITQRNIYVIETKRKSGTIFADANSREWKVVTAHGESSMRNALLQSKNAVRVLHQQFALPFPPIPMVAIMGNNLNIVGGPGNVFDAQLVISAMDGFDYAQKEIRINPKEVLDRLTPFIVTDALAKKRHIERANLAGYKATIANIVNTASVDIH